MADGFGKREQIPPCRWACRPASSHVTWPVLYQAFGILVDNDLGIRKGLENLKFNLIGNPVRPQQVHFAVAALGPDETTCNALRGEAVPMPTLPVLLHSMTVGLDP